jgi:hypothetical protein
MCTLKVLKNHPGYSKRRGILLPSLHCPGNALTYPIFRFIGHLQALECTVCLLQGDHASHVTPKVSWDLRSSVPSPRSWRHRRSCRCFLRYLNVALNLRCDHRRFALFVAGCEGRKGYLRALGVTAWNLRTTKERLILHENKEIKGSWGTC